MMNELIARLLIAIPDSQIAIHPHQEGYGCLFSKGNRIIGMTGKTPQEALLEIVGYLAENGFYPKNEY